jgi:hypothetical protein
VSARLQLAEALLAMHGLPPLSAALDLLFPLRDSIAEGSEHYETFQAALNRARALLCVQEELIQSEQPQTLAQAWLACGKVPPRGMPFVPTFAVAALTRRWACWTCRHSCSWRRTRSAGAARMPPSSPH